MEKMTAGAVAERLLRETEKVIIGKEETVRLVLTGIFSGGHILLEDLPESGKTTLFRTLSLALGCGFRRFQFTPDLIKFSKQSVPSLGAKTAR